MKKLLIIFAVVLFTVGFASRVSAQTGGLVTKSNSAGGEIMAPLTLSAAATLEFGKMAVHATNPGYVVLTPASVATGNNGVTLMTGTAPHAAKYDVTGSAGYTYKITLPGDGDVTIKNANNDEMTVTNFSYSSVNTSLNGGTLVGGVDIFYVGARLNVDGGQAEGVYTGSFSVSVNYE